MKADYRRRTCSAFQAAFPRKQRENFWIGFVDGARFEVVPFPPLCPDRTANQGHDEWVMGEVEVLEQLEDWSVVDVVCEGIQYD